ncbi:MAG: hypothetical protein ACQESR_07730 [Planctomycetota bacterium]
MESGPAQAGLRLVGLAVDKITRDRYMFSSGLTPPTCGFFQAIPSFS